MQKCSIIIFVQFRRYNTIINYEWFCLTTVQKAIVSQNDCFYHYRRKIPFLNVHVQSQTICSSIRSISHIEAFFKIVVLISSTHWSYRIYECLLYTNFQQLLYLWVLHWLYVTYMFNFCFIKRIICALFLLDISSLTMAHQSYPLQSKSSFFGNYYLRCLILFHNSAWILRVLLHHLPC